MFKILDRYIIKNLILSTAVVGLIIVGILFLLSLLAELKNIGNGDYTLTQAFIYVLLRLPNQLYQFSPLLILMGTITGLSILSSQRELAVMRVSGFSIFQMTMSVIMAALIMIVSITFICEWIGPNLSAKATVQKEVAQNGGQAVVTTEGIWMHIDNNFINIRQIINKKLLAGITRYEFNNQHQLLATYYAASLQYDHGEWNMQNVVKTSFYKDLTQSEHIETLPWHLKLNTNLLNLALIDPSEMSLPKLAQFSYYLEQNHLQSVQYQFDFWQRVFQPLASLVMIFLAIPFVLGVQMASTMSFRIIVGILAGFVFFMFNAFLGQLSVVYQIPPFLAALLPLLVFVALSIYLSKRLIVH